MYNRSVFKRNLSTAIRWSDCLCTFQGSALPLLPHSYGPYPLCALPRSHGSETLRTQKAQDPGNSATQGAKAEYIVTKEKAGNSLAPGFLFRHDETMVGSYSTGVGVNPSKS